MTTIFPKWTNRCEVAAIAGFGGLCFAIAIVWYYFTPKFWEVGYMPDQPVNFSHQVHAGQLGMDCRYCHTHVEQSFHSNVPQTSTCMSCHTVVDAVVGVLAKATSADGQRPSRTGSARTSLCSAAYESGQPVEWARIHKVPDYALPPRGARQRRHLVLLLPRAHRHHARRLPERAALDGLVP